MFYNVPQMTFKGQDWTYTPTVLAPDADRPQRPG
jgi:hypothetical protein